MSSIPTIDKQDISVNSIRLCFQVTDAIKWFDGHFPGKPILPGVVQVDWAIHFARKHFFLPGGFQRMEKIKFQNLITPGQQLVLLLEKKTDDGRFSFRYEQGDKVFSSGILNLGGDV